MPEQSYNHYLGAEKVADLLNTALANAVIHLFQDDGFAPGVTTPLADFTLHEADFDGYTALAVVTWPNQFVIGTSWANLDPVRFDFNSGAPAGGGNQIKGWYLVSAAGVLIAFGILDPSVPMQADGQVCFVNPAFLVPFQQTL